MRSVLFLFGEFLHGLSQNKFLHFTHGAQVTISLVVMGIFMVLLVGALVVWGKLGESMEIHVFLEDGISAMQINSIEREIGELDHVTSVYYRSKEEAAETFSKTWGLITVDELEEENPLPDSYIVKADRPSHIEGIADGCSEIPGTLAVRYGQQWLVKYMRVVAALGVICAVTMLLLLLFTYSSINNIIGMSIYARRNEIRIMQLVGATWWFIRWPFILEGMFIGAVGSVAAFLIVWLLLAMAAEAMRASKLDLAIPSLGLDGNLILVGLAILLLGLALIVGFAGSLRTVNNFLRKEAQVALDASRIRQLTR
jgi:cell division transport system permease protein